MASKSNKQLSLIRKTDELIKNNDPYRYRNSDKVKGLTKDVIVEAEGKKVDYSKQDPLNIKKKQTNKKATKSREVQRAEKRLQQKQLGKQIRNEIKQNTKRGYAITDSNRIMQNYANKTGSYDATDYARQTYGTYQLPKKQESLGKKATRLAVSVPVAMADFAKGAVFNTGEAVVDFAKRGEYFNNWLFNKLGVMSDKERLEADWAVDDFVKRDLSGEMMRNLGWDEENERVLKDYSYLTGNTKADKFIESLGEQVPTYMMGYAGSQYMTGGKGAEAAIKSLKGLKGTDLIKTAVGNVGKASLLNSGSNIPIALTSYNSGFEEALRNGATREQARKYAMANAATEIATEWTTGGIPGLENSTGLLSKKAGDLLDKTTGNIKNEYLKPIARSLLKYTGGAAGEGFEEALSEIISPYIKNATYTEGEKVNWNEVTEAALMGMASAGIFSFGQNLSEMAGEIKTVKQKNQVIKQIEQVSNLQVQELDEGVKNGDITPEEGTQAIEYIKAAAENRINQINQTYENRNNPNAEQNSLNRELAKQQVQIIEQQVRNGQISPQDGTQRINEIQNYLRAIESNQTAPTTNETQQSNVIGQEQQNIAQNANNEVVQNQQQNGNLVEDYMSDNYGNMVEDYIDQNYGQQQESNLVEDYMNNGEDNLVNDYMNDYEDGNMVENFMNAQNELQQTQQDNIKKQTNAFNLGQNETKLPTNTDDKIQNFRNSVKNENVKDADGFYKAVEKIISDKDYNVILDSSIKNKQGRAVNALISNENGITIKINPNSNRAAEILLMHEVTHGIETKEMSNLIMDYASKNSKFNEALESLKKAYGTNDVTSEVVADISGQLFGNQEFINNLSTEKPGVFKRIYNKIVELANKLTGNSKQALFIRDLKNKWEKAYREANIESSQIKLKDQVKYSQNGEITDNKGRELNINMQNYMEDSQATDDKGQLVTLYHTTTDMIKQFNVFDPANKYDGKYKFGKYNVTYLTDNQEMSGSYSKYDYRKANTKRLNSIEEANEYLDYNSSLRIIDIENTNQAIKNHFEGNPNRYFLVSGDLTTFGEYKTEQELLRDVIPTSQWVMRGNSNFQYEVYANITKPFIIDAEGRNWDNISREIVQEYKDVVDNLSQEQKQELAKYAEDSINKYSDWATSEKYTEYLKYNDEYKKLDNTTEENLVLLSMKENVTPQDYIDMYNEFKEGKAPDSKITIDGEEMTFAEYAARWCNLEMENADYSSAYSYFWTQARKQYRNQLQQVGVEKMFDMAKYGFKDWAVEDTLSRTLETNDIVNKVIEMNENGDDYDGVIIMNTTDYGPGYVEEKDPHDVYVVFNSNQIKSVDNPDPTNDPDIRYSEKAKQWQDFLEKNYKNTGTTTKLNEKIGTEEKQTEVPQAQKQPSEPVTESGMNQEKLDALTNKLRENRQQRETKAAEERKVIAERKGNNVTTAKTYTKDFQDAQTGKLDKKKLRKYVGTSNEATGMQKSIDKADLDRLTYETQSNDSTYKKARKNLEGLSYEDRLSRSRNLLSSDKRVTAVDVAEAQITMLEAAQSGRVQDYLDLQQDLAIMGTEAGQTIQAMSMIQKMSPDGQLQTLLKIIDRQQKLGNKNYENVKLNENLVQEVLDSYDDVNHTTFNKEKLDNAMDALKQDIADQMKVSWAEKANEWRYLSMLGNPKTHIRNMVGNFAMSLVKSVKDYQSAAAQDLLGKLGVIDKSSKTATLKWAGKDVRKLAKEYYSEFQKLEDSGSKYSEKANIEQQRRIFKPGLIEWIRKANLKALKVEDNWFKNFNYRKSFSNFLTAKGIRTEADIKANPQIVQDANNYAIQQAKIATFQQDNKIANWIRQADKLGKGAEVVRGAIIPFTSVPMNIAQTGIEYTPGLGMFKTISDFKKAAPGDKAITLIDGIAKQTTGTSLALIGYALAKAGMVTADAGDDKEDKFEKDIGAKMNYSIKFGDKSYDLSWLSPSSMPFFVGASMFEQLEKDQGVSGNLITQALASTLDPLSEMSVISSFFDVLDSYEKDAAGKIMKAGESTLQNYVSQYIPTAFSQMAKALDDKKRDTYASKNSPWSFGEETIKQLAYKIPGARNLLPEQKDFLGRTKKEAYISDNKIVNAFEAFFSPVNVRKDTSDEVTKELIDIYNKTGGESLIPTKNAYAEFFKYKNKKYDLNKKEYNEFKEDAGEIATKEIEKLINDSDYKKLSDDKKAKALANIMQYSRYKAKYDYFEDKGIDYYNQTFNTVRERIKNGEYSLSDYYLDKQSENNKRYKALEKKGVDAETFDAFREFASKTKADKTKNGGYVRNSKKKKIINYIQGLSLSKEGKEALYEDYKKNQRTFTTYK